MEADWEIEIGQEAPIQQAPIQQGLIQQGLIQEAPIIDACWPGLVDLRTNPERVRELPEVHQLPALADALVRLNATDSPVWTAKCDVWPVAEPCAEFDRFELDSPVEAAVHGLACYIDLLPVSEWVLPEKAIASCENLCARLRSVPLRCCRVDLVIRRAL